MIKKIKMILFCVLVISTLIWMNEVLLNKNINLKIKAMTSHENDYLLSCKADGFYELEKNSLDVIFFGSSQVHCGINPVQLYDEYNITSYDFSADQQDIGTTYYYLKEAFKTQSPQVVVVDIGSSVREKLGAVSAHFSFDFLKLSMNKIKAIVNRTNPQDWLELFFPFVQYHTRWKNLSDLDFSYIGREKQNFLAGYIGYYVTVPGAKPIYDEKISNEKLNETEEQELFEVLYNMKELCKENDAELILLKLPYTSGYSINNPMINSVEKFAQQENIEFWNYVYDNEEIGLDFSKDFADTAHMNFMGSEKMTSFLGDRLQKRIVTKEKTEEVKQYWEQCMETYDRVHTIGELKVASIEPTVEGENLYHYLETVSQNKDLCALIVGKGQNGVILDWYNLKSDDNGIWNYIGIIDGGEWKLANNTSEAISESYMIGTDQFVITSNSEGGDCKIVHNGKTLGNIAVGLNIYVWDKERNEVADYKVFDIYKYAQIRESGKGE